MAGQKLARDDRVTFAAAWRPRVSREVTPLINSAVASSLPSPPPPSLFHQPRLCWLSLGETAPCKRICVHSYQDSGCLCWESEKAASRRLIKGGVWASKSEALREATNKGAGVWVSREPGTPMNGRRRRKRRRKERRRKNSKELELKQ